MSAGGGEEVSSDVIREYRSLSSERLTTIRGQGLSDQRVALIDTILAEREAKVQTPEGELLKRFEEPRSARDVEVDRVARQYITEGLTAEEAIKKARETTQTTVAKIREARERKEETKTIKDIPPERINNDLSNQTALTPTPTYYDVAPNWKDRYKKAISGNQFITGSLSFLGSELANYYETRQIKRMRKDPSYKLYQVKPTKKLISTTVQVAPYFIPFVGYPLMFGAGVESIGTKEGRGKIGSTSSYLKEQYNIPTPVSTITQYAFAGGMSYIGGRGIYKGIEKGFGLPKSDTKILGVNQQVQENKVITSIGFETKTKKLFGSKTTYGVARGTTYIDPSKGNNIQFGETITEGFFWKPKGTGIKTKLTDPRQFNVISRSVSRKTLMRELNIFTPTYDKSSIIFTLKKTDGSSQIFGGKIAVGKPNQIYTNPIKGKFVGYGGSKITQIQDVNKVFGKTGLIKEGEILKQGQGSYEGYIANLKKPSSSGVRYISGSGKKSSQDFLNLLYRSTVKYPSEVLKVTQSAEASVSLSQQANKFKVNIPQILRPPSKQDFQTETPSSDRQVTKTKQEFYSIPKQEPKTKTKTKTRFRTGQTYYSPSIVISDPIQKDKTFQIPRQTITPISTTKNITKLIPISPKPLTPFKDKPIGFTILPILLPPLGMDSKGLGKRRIPIRRIVKYTPSYSAVIFKIFGKKPTGVETGLRVRPIPKGFSFSNLFGFKRRIIKKRRKKGGKR